MQREQEEAAAVQKRKKIEMEQIEAANARYGVIGSGVGSRCIGCVYE